MSAGDRPGGGQRGKEGGGIFPEAPKLDPLPRHLPPNTPAFWLFRGQGYSCPPLKCKELRSVPQAPLGAGIGLEINVVVPARPGKVGAAPREGGTRCYCARCLAPPQEGRPQARTGLAGADCLGPCALPARAWAPLGCGAPAGPPGPRPSNWPYGSCPWPLGQRAGSGRCHHSASHRLQ